ncbi:MAG: glycosyltransferase family 2 protein [Desulfobacterota bacterium]|jgi:dolichyl-phosphate beta-glucosyltransferase|nr:glycosyltransferase family 2 protein [Thermodesulfobacteriota bacterium]
MSKLSDFISIIIPGYNEEKRIARSLTALSAFCEAHFDRYEIVFVNDGSKDKTRAIVESLTIPFFRTILLESNQGKGAAVRTGMLAARGDYRFFTDADLPYDLSAFVEAMSVFHSGPCHGVVGARDLPESFDQSGQSFFREMTSKGFSALVRFMLKVDVKDTQCGFKGFTAEAAEKIFPLSSLKGYAFDVELFLLARTWNLRLCKVPVSLVERHHSKVRLSLDAPMMFWEVMKMYRRYKGHGARCTEQHI